MRKQFVINIAIALGLSVGVSTRADAQCVPGGGAPNAGPFCIDGVITPADNSGVAPQALFTPDDNASKEFGAVNGNHTKVGVINFPMPPFTKGGPNSNPPVLGDESITDKVNLLGVYTQGAVDNGDFWFYYAWIRATTSGSGFMAVEFQRGAKPVACSSNYDPFNKQALIDGCNPWANRDGDGTPSNSDFMILWDQTGNTIGPQNIFVRFYNKSLAAFGPAQDLTLAGAAVALYGLNDSSKGEMALNFSAIVGGAQSQCITFANILPTTVTGNSDTADYKDTILNNFPIASNCGIVTVKKVTVPASTGIDFQYTLDKADDAMIFGVPTPDSDCSVTASLFSCVGALQHNETDTISDLLAGTNYNLIESDKPGNYGLTSIICTTEGGTPYNITAGGDFPVEATKTTACVITNTLLTANLIVIKVVNNNFGLTAVPGDFSFTKELGAAQPFANGGVSCVSGATCKTFTYNVGDAYAITETASLPVGYSKVSEVGCSGTMTVLGGTCTITNQDSIAVPTLFTRMKIVLLDRATIGGIRAGGSSNAGDNQLVIRLYSDATCTTQAASQTFAANADGTFTTDPGHTLDFNAAVDPEQNSVFRWRAFYSGNSFNQPQSTLCSDEAIALTVFQK